MHWSQYPSRPSVASLRAQAKRMIEDVKRKRRDVEPVELQGNRIAETWWGISWNKNLERYADYVNRIGRGRSYVRNGLVLDLKITGGRVSALVAGSSPIPYEVTIEVNPASAAKNRELVNATTSSIESVEALLDGEFPEALKALLFSQDSGLFPSPRELSFQCSCPDRAAMCKHIAAVLYGIGSRVDSKPELFFLLRGIDPEKFAGSAARKESHNLLKKKPGSSSRIIQSADISALFGVDVKRNRGSK